MSTIKSENKGYNRTFGGSMKSYCQACKGWIFAKKTGEDGVLICDECYKKIKKDQYLYETHV